LKSFLLALPLSAAAMLPVLSTANAQSVVIREQHPSHHDDWHHRHGDWHHHCVVRTEKIHRHGHTIIKKDRVCR
jgi:hypothetical protein